MKSRNFSYIHYAEHLRVAMQILGKSATDILALFPDKEIQIFDDYIEIPLENIILSSMLNNKMEIEKVRLFTNTNEEILSYVEYLQKTFIYILILNGWYYNGFIILLDMKYEWCISLEKIRLSS